MNFWRTTAAIALVGAFSAASAMAAMAPKAPAAAGKATSALCVKETNLVLVDGLAMCVERNTSTSSFVGNGFPWENSAFFFSTFRNQYLFPSVTINNEKAVALTIESIGARSTSFTGASTNVYGSMPNGDPSFIRVTDNAGGASSISPTFSVNTGPTVYCELTATNADTITIDTRTGPNGSTVSQCASCLEPESWCSIGDLNDLGATPTLLVDHLGSVAAGGAGAGVWDTGFQGSANGCGETQRAFGSGSFANPSHLTTALAVDNFDFVWVFKGLSPPPAMTVEQQIAEIVRLLLTPQGLRCSSLDRNPGNGLIEDDPIQFPDGASIDPISPQIGSGGEVTGDELIDNLRQAGWNN